MPFFNLTYVDFDKGSYKYVDDFDNIILLTFSNYTEILVQYNDIQYRFNMVSLYEKNYFNYHRFYSY